MMDNRILEELKTRKKLGKKDFRECYGEFSPASELCGNCSFEEICKRMTGLIENFEGDLR